MSIQDQAEAKHSRQTLSKETQTYKELWAQFLAAVKADRIATVKYLDQRDRGPHENEWVIVFGPNASGEIEDDMYSAPSWESREFLDGLCAAIRRWIRSLEVRVTEYDKVLELDWKSGKLECHQDTDFLRHMAAALFVEKCLVYSFQPAKEGETR